jgi:hypothetical protein
MMERFRIAWCVTAIDVSPLGLLVWHCTWHSSVSQSMSRASLISGHEGVQDGC